MTATGPRLTKADVEQLLAQLDKPTLQTALLGALRKVLGASNDADWLSIVEAAGMVGGWDMGRVQALRSEQTAALQDLAVELNEDRTVVKR
jgi:hypothetical protein